MRFVLILATAILLGPIAAPAQTNNAPAQSRTIPGIPLQDPDAGDSLLDRLDRLWEGTKGLFSMTATINATSQMRGGRQEDNDFRWLMNIAGYKLKEIESTVGLIPGLGLNFAVARELTEADRDYVERELERHARRNPGPISAIQRSIVYGVLEASDLGKYGIEKVEIDLLPLPKVKILMTPVDAPVSQETSRVLRAIERLNSNINSLMPRQRGTQLPLWIPEDAFVPVSAPDARRL